MILDPQRRSKAGRRRFVTSLGAAGAGFWLSTPRSAGAAEGEEEVTPVEDLMREHGVLKRVLLVYDEATRRIDAGEELPLEPLREGATIVRDFIESYHEKLEEEQLFPRFERANRLVDLTRVLREQHRAGRRVTERVLEVSEASKLKDAETAARLRGLLRAFGRMYAPHEAREDTVLFPAVREIVSKEEYGALGEDFEREEHRLFGEDGFERMVDRVATIEKALGIHALEQFTPSV